MDASYRTAPLVAMGVLFTLAAVVFVDIPSTTRLAREIQDTAHAPAFALVAWLFVKALSPHSRPSARIYVAAFAICVLLAIGSEALQHVLARDVSLLDIGRDILGATAALSIHAASGIGFRIRRGLWLLSALAIVLAFVQLVWISAAYIHRWRQFPVLAEFDSSFDLSFVRIRSQEPRSPRVILGANERALRVSLDAGPWSGVELEEPYPNWSGYERLRITLANPTARDLVLTVRINDAEHNHQFADRLNVPIELPARDRRTFNFSLDDLEKAPRSRRMNLRRIANLQIFSVDPVPSGEFALERIWLE